MALNPKPIPRSIYLAKRNPRLSREEFGPRWRQHSLLAGSCMSIRQGFAQVAQCINVYDREVVPRASFEYDGVNILSFQEQHFVQAVWQKDEVHDLLLPDELDTFSTYVRYFTLAADGHIVSPGPMQPFCLLHFLKRDRRLSMEEFANGLADAHAAVGAGGRRAAVNLVTDRVPGYNFDAVTELWFADLDDARAFFAAEAWTGTYLGQRDRLCDEPRTLTMWTRINYARPSLEEQGG